MFGPYILCTLLHRFNRKTKNVLVFAIWFYILFYFQFYLSISFMFTISMTSDILSYSLIICEASIWQLNPLMDWCNVLQARSERQHAPGSRRQLKTARLKATDCADNWELRMETIKLKTHQNLTLQNFYLQQPSTPPSFKS